MNRGEKWLLLGLLMVSGALHAEPQVCDGNVVGTQDWILVEPAGIKGLPCQVTVTVTNPQVTEVPNHHAYVLREMTEDFETMVIDLDLEAYDLALNPEDVWTFLVVEFDAVRGLPPARVQLSLLEGNRSDSGWSIETLVVVDGEIYASSMSPVPSLQEQIPVTLDWVQRGGSMGLMLGDDVFSPAITPRPYGKPKRIRLGLFNNLNAPVSGSELGFVNTRLLLEDQRQWVP